MSYSLKNRFVSHSLFYCFIGLTAQSVLPMWPLYAFYAGVTFFLSILILSYLGAPHFFIHSLTETIEKDFKGETIPSKTARSIARWFMKIHYLAVIAFFMFQGWKFCLIIEIINSLAYVYFTGLSEMIYSQQSVDTEPLNRGETE